MIYIAHKSPLAELAAAPEVSDSYKLFLLLLSDFAALMIFESLVCNPHSKEEHCKAPHISATFKTVLVAIVKLLNK